MKKNFFLLFIALFAIGFAGNNASAQTIKTEAARELAKIDKQIFESRNRLQMLQKKFDDLRTEYRVGADEIKDIRQMIVKIENAISDLERTRKHLVAQPQTRPLPSTQIELLKILVLQNERILDRLEEKGEN